MITHTSALTIHAVSTQLRDLIIFDIMRKANLKIALLYIFNNNVQ